MRLVERKEDGELSLTEDFDKNIPDYAILSHCWGNNDQEVNFNDMKEASGETKAGYQKIRFCAAQATRDKLQYFWVDTCRIDKSGAVELQKSINFMFRWYKNSVKCYDYLSDVWIPDEGAENASPGYPFLHPNDLKSQGQFQGQRSPGASSSLLLYSPKECDDTKQYKSILLHLKSTQEPQQSLSLPPLHHP